MPSVKGIVSDYLDRFGTIDAVWMDAGASALAVIETFEDAGQPVPIMVGEDQQDFLAKWQADGLTAIAPTFPTFQWRTPIIAALQIMNGEPVPDVWRLPQPTVTQENLDEYVQPNMPPLHYAMCGCEDMPDFPQSLGRPVVEHSVLETAVGLGSHTVSISCCFRTQREIQHD
jgi:ribose transport system substrate-binding protein